MRKVDALQCEQACLAVGAGGISGQSAVRPQHAVAWDDDADGIVPDGTPDGLCREGRQSPAASQLVRNVAVGHRMPVGDGEQDAPHLAPEGSAFQADRGQAKGLSAGEISIEPTARLPEDGQVTVGTGVEPTCVEMPLAHKPEARQTSVLSGHHHLPERGCVGVFKEIHSVVICSQK